MTAQTEIYKIVASIKYAAPVAFRVALGEETTALGYFRTFLVAGISIDDAKHQVSSDVTDGEVDWADSETTIADSSDFPEKVVINREPKAGILWKSSHFLF